MMTHQPMSHPTQQTMFKPTQQTMSHPKLIPKINHILSDYSKFMTEGLRNSNIWGYGFNRLNVTAMETSRCPYGFTSFGYKQQTGELFLGMRMNIDQFSPVKFIEWDGRSDIMDLLSKLMNNLLNEFLSANS